MIVDLDKNACLDCYVSEITMSGQDNMNMPYSTWRSMLSENVAANDRDYFLQQTEPEYVRSRLLNTKYVFFEIQMFNLSGTSIWARHSLIRIQDLEEKNLYFLYTVQDISEQKSYDDRIAARMAEQSGSPEPDSPEDDKKKKGSLLSELILQRVIQDIQFHYMDNLTLKNMGDKYYINSAYLGQLFIKKFGIPFNEYLCSYRIRQAASLLRSTIMPVSEVMLSTGYASTSYFNQKFKEAFGCSPSVYRKKSRFTS